MKCLSSQDYGMGSAHRPDYFGVLLDHDRVEVDLLDRLDLRGGDSHPRVLPTRDLRSGSPRPARRPDPQGGPQRQRLGGLGAGAPGLQTSRRRRADPPHPYAHHGANRRGHMSLPGALVRHILHELPGLPHHLPGRVRSIPRRDRAVLPAHRPRCPASRSYLLRVRPHPLPGASTARALGGEGGGAAGASRLLRGADVRGVAVLARVVGGA